MAGDIGDELRGLRWARGLGVDEVARRCGVSKASLSGWENGKRRPRGPALARLLDVLEVSPRTKARILHLADPQQARVELSKSAFGGSVDVGMVLRVMREGRGMTQSDLARKVGVSQAAVSKWELGESAPSVEMIHAVGFALGATGEETVALASALGRGESGLSLDPEVAREQVWDRSVDHRIREVSLLGWEAEIARRAAWDAGWDACLVAVLAARANWLVYEERYSEIVPLAWRALKVATTLPGQMEAVPALAALADADRHSGRDHAHAAQLAGTWSDKLPESLFKAWMLRQTGMSLVRLGQTRRGVGLVERSAEMDLRLSIHPEPWAHRVAMLCEAYLEAGEPRKAAALLGGRRSRELTPTISIQVDHANGRAATQAEMAYLRFQTESHAPSPLDRRRLLHIERRQAWLKGERFSPHRADPVPNHPGAEDQLWEAVVRESRG